MTTDARDRRENDPGADTGAYALNALSPAERDEFERRMAGSEQLRNEVTEMADTAVLLGLAVDPVQPSPSLKASLLAQIAVTPQLPREVPGAATAETVVAPPAELSDALDQKVRARWFSRPAIAITAAAAAVALILGGGVVANIVSNSGSQSVQADQLAALYSASDVQRRAADVSTGGTATLVSSASLGISALVVKGIPKLADDRTYQLWYIDAAGTPVSAGLMDAATQDWAILDGKFTPGTTVGVTVEPRGGSDAPTTTPIVAIASA